ncbi:MAG TPA: hypothetical protein VFT82_02315, partial [Candidatus Paceibacterota bacterium]|nr:hypothetical protein [Candidatus Paceibacterota bacterium]
MNKAIIGLAWALCASIAFSVSAHARSVSRPSTPAFAQVSASTNVQPTVNWTVDGQSLKSKPLVAGDSYQPIATFYGDNPSSVDASFRYIYVYSRGLTNV